MITQDAQGKIIYNDPVENAIQRGAQSLNNQQFSSVKNMPTATDYQNTWANLPPRDYRTFGDKLKAHYDAFTKDPWAWAQDNPWKAAGGIGALTAGMSNSGNNSNNRPNSFNMLSSLIPGLLVGGLVYGGIKAWPWLKNQFKDIEQVKQDVAATVKNARDLSNKANDKMRDAEVVWDKIRHSKAGRALFGKPTRSPILRDSKGGLHTTGRKVIYDETKGHYIYDDTSEKV